MSEKRKLPDWFFVVLAVVCVAWVVLLVCVSPAFADDFTPDDVTYLEHDTLDLDVGDTVQPYFTTDDVAKLLAAVQATPPADNDENSVEDLPDTVESNGESLRVTSLNDAVTPDSSSLPGLVTAVLGEYTPRTQTVTTYLFDGTTLMTVEPVPGIAGLDWYWIGGLFLFALVLWSFFRFLGVIFKHG